MISKLGEAINIERDLAGRPDDWPRLSVIGTLYNQCKSASRVLLSYLYQSFSEPYEILIMDDGSTDGSDDMIVDLQLLFPNKIRYFYFRQPKITPWLLPINAGIRKARADIVVIALGLDRIPLQNALEELYTPHLEYDRVFVTLLNRHIGVSSSMEVISEDEVDSLLHKIRWREDRQRLYKIAGPMASTHTAERMDESPCFSVQKRWLEAVGGYDERYTTTPTFANLDLWMRMKRFGLTPIFGEGAVFHQPHKALRLNRGPMTTEYLKYKDQGIVRNLDGWGKYPYEFERE